MNKDLINKEKQLKEEDISLEFTISRIKSVLKNQSFYQKPESLEALKKIKEYLEKTEQRLKDIEEEQKQLHQQIKDSCLHEIIIKTSLNTNCCICRRLFIDPPEFEHILLEYNHSVTPNLYTSIDETISEIANNNGNLLDEFEDKITTKVKGIRLYRRTQ